VAAARVGATAVPKAGGTAAGEVTEEEIVTAVGGTAAAGLKAETG